jgi:hypothetical protein
MNRSPNEILPALPPASKEFRAAVKAHAKAVADLTAARGKKGALESANARERLLTARTWPFNQGEVLQDTSSADAEVANRTGDLDAAAAALRKARADREGSVRAALKGDLDGYRRAIAERLAELDALLERGEALVAEAKDAGINLGNASLAGSSALRKVLRPLANIVESWR